MTDIKWIKIATDIFEDEKMIIIQAEPDADSIIIIWFKLLCMAGRSNNKGVFTMNGEPITDAMFSIIFRCPVEIVTKAFKLFLKYGMIQINDGVLSITNFNKHQSIEEYERAKELNKERNAKYRAKQKKRDVSMTLA
jgi:predicted phage replisome organizer